VKARLALPRKLIEISSHIYLFSFWANTNVCPVVVIQ
jgi:hypothetical protein